jgi:hypothetical protein
MVSGPEGLPQVAHVVHHAAPGSARGGRFGPVAQAGHAGDAGPGRGGQGVEVVAAFEQGDAVAGGDEGKDAVGQVGKVSRAQSEIGQRVGPVGIKPG